MTERRACLHPSISSCSAAGSPGSRPRCAPDARACRSPCVTKGELGWSATRYAQGGVAAALDPGDDSPELHGSDTLVGRRRALRHRRGARCSPARVRTASASSSRSARTSTEVDGGDELRPGPRRAATPWPGSCTPAATPPAPRSSGRWSPRCAIRRRRPRALARAPTCSSSRAGRRASPCSTPDGAAPPSALATCWSRPAVPASASRSPPTRRSRPATASPWPCAPAPPSPTSSSCSSTRPRCTTRRCRARCCRRRSGARARSCATSAASRSWPASTRSPTSRRATWWPRRSAAAASNATSTTSGSTPPPSTTSPRGSRPSGRRASAVGLDPTRDWLPVAPAAHYLSGGVCTDLDGATTLPGSVGLRRGRVHRRARRQPAGVELAARRPGVRGARGRGHPRRARRAPSPPACSAVSRRSSAAASPVTGAHRRPGRRSARSCSGS